MLHAHDQGNLFKSCIYRPCSNQIKFIWLWVFNSMFSYDLYGKVQSHQSIFHTSTKTSCHLQLDKWIEQLQNKSSSVTYKCYYKHITASGSLIYFLGPALNGAGVKSGSNKSSL